MISVLNYGDRATVQLDPGATTSWIRCEVPQGRPLENIAKTVRRILDAPLELPPLARAVVPGDKVALAIAEPIGEIAAIVSQTIKMLVASGVTAEDISVIHTQGDDAPGTAEWTAAGAHVISHDPAQRESLSYLAASAEGKPIYINRVIHDADLVISIGRVWPKGSLGDHGMHAGLLAAFSDTANRDRYHSPKPSLPAQRDRLRTDADEAGWLLGAGYTIRVVPGPCGAALDVIAGEIAAVDRQAQIVYDNAWRFPIANRAELVIATIEGDVSEQSWENVARALESAAHAADSEGAIVVCTELAEPPGAGMQQLMGADNLSDALRAIVHHKPSDAMAAGAMVRALERGSVYLISRLDDDVVEDLGLHPLKPGELSRLASHYRSVLVIPNAPYAVAQVKDEVANVRTKHGRLSK